MAATPVPLGTGEAVIALAGVVHHYGAGALRKQILFDVAAEVRPGEIVIMTGPSGSGKTTLLTLIGALREPQQGSVRVLGQELLGAGEGRRVRVRRQIGYIFQSHNLLRSLTALGNVQMSLRDCGLSRSEARRRAEETLAAVGLADQAAKYSDQLSGGQRQRVAVARALARRPRIVLADEPTASLDKASGLAVVEFLARLAREQGCAVLLVTHDNRILGIADRIIHMEDGRLSTFGSEVASSTRRMLEAFARTNRKGEIVDRVRALPFSTFAQFVEQLTRDFQEFLATLELSEHDAFDSMLEQVLEAFTGKLADVVQADRATLFLVDRARGELVAQVVHGQAELRLPLGAGIAGHVAESGRPLNVPDAYAEPRFDREVDRRTGYVTRSLLSMPIADSKGATFAVMQFLNKAGGGPFDAADERAFADAAAAIAVTLEVWCRMRGRRAQATA
jgi:putative ABC transport system ATP-binding protein